MRVFAFPLVVSFLLAIPAGAQTLRDYAALHDHLRQRVTAARDREARAEQSAQRSNTLTQSAASSGDVDALAVAREATATAERALRNARALRERRERELREFEDGIRAAVAAGRPVGYPVLVRQGEISLVTPGGTREYDGSALKPGDRISTGPNSTIVIVLPDAGGAKLTLGPNSMFELSPADSPSAFRLVRGWYRELVKCVGTPSRQGYCIRRKIQIRATTACACVRGTEYSAEVLDAQTIRLEVFDGVVDFRDDADRLVRTIERGMRVTARYADGAWTIVPEGVAMRGSAETEIRSRSSANLKSLAF